MENEKDKTTAENTNSQPKPNDDVQLEIETVVPSAHKEEVNPSTPVENQQSSDQESEKQQPSDRDEKTEQSGAESKAPISEGKEVTEGEDANNAAEEAPKPSAEDSVEEDIDEPESVPEEKSEDDKNDDPEDKRGDIETVSV